MNNNNVNSNNLTPLSCKADSFRPLKSAVAFAALITSSVALFSAVDASAHGYISTPKSRVIQCKENGIENPTHPACIAAKAAGNGGLYTPQEVAVGGVKDDHRDFIPDGKLCSVGRSNLAGMDLNRTDWPTTRVNPGPMDFIWTNTAPHKTTYFRYYITREGHDFSHPLRWDDLELIHDSGFADQEAVSIHNVDLPYRTGRHVVYSIWQRDWVRDAAEGFYQCVDVDFGDGGGNNSSASSTSSSSSSEASSSSSESGDTCTALTNWDSGSVYTSPTQVKHSDKRYQAKWWTQGDNPATNSDNNGVWLDLGACGGSPVSSSSSSSSSSSVSSSSSSSSNSSSSSSTPSSNCASPSYVDGSTYANGALVQNGGSEYSCTVGGWCSVGGPYAPGAGWAWDNAWSLLRSCH